MTDVEETLATLRGKTHFEDADGHRVFPDVTHTGEGVWYYSGLPDANSCPVWVKLSVILRAEFNASPPTSAEIAFEVYDDE